MNAVILILVLFLFLILYHFGYYKSYYDTKTKETKDLEDLEAQYNIQLENMKEKYKAIVSQVLEAVAKKDPNMPFIANGTNDIN